MLKIIKESLLVNRLPEFRHQMQAIMYDYLLEDRLKIAEKSDQLKLNVIGFRIAVS